MKKLFKQLSIFFFLLSFMFLLSFIFTPPVHVESGLYGNIDKVNRLANISSPKLIVIGGSNVSFGIDSQMMEDTLGMTVVNMGLHAGVGLRYMIDQVIPFVKEDDVVLLCPEHAQFGDMYHGNDKLLTLVHDVMPDTSTSLTPSAYYYLADEFPAYIGSKCIKFLTFWLDRTQELKSDVYTRAQFNSYGDAVAHFGFPSKKVKIKVMNFQLHTGVIAALNQYQETLEKKGAQLMVGHPALQNTCFQHSSDYILKFNALLESDDVAFPIITKQEDYVFDDSLFFDTIYHLTKEGREQRTKKLCADVKQALAVSY